MKRTILYIIFLLYAYSAASQETKIMSSGYLKTNDTVLVYKPSCFDINKEYAAVFLLHRHIVNGKTGSNKKS